MAKKMHGEGRLEGAYVDLACKGDLWWSTAQQTKGIETKKHREARQAIRILAHIISACPLEGTKQTQSERHITCIAWSGALITYTITGTKYNVQG